MWLHEGIQYLLSFTCIIHICTLVGPVAEAIFITAAIYPFPWSAIAIAHYIINLHNRHLLISVMLTNSLFISTPPRPIEATMVKFPYTLLRTNLLITALYCLRTNPHYTVNSTTIVCWLGKHHHNICRLGKHCNWAIPQTYISGFTDT